MDQQHKTTGRVARGNVGARLAYASAFAAALLVLAARPAAAQGCSAGEGTLVCGFVWNDVVGDGIQSAGEPGLDGVTVTASNGTDTISTTTDSFGFYSFSSQDLPPDTYRITIDATVMPAGTLVSPSDQGSDDSIDSDGLDSGTGISYVDVTIADTFTLINLDFGFHTPQTQYPGTGTPGYWKNHPDAWPAPYATKIKVGGVTYTKAQAISWLGKVGKDKTTTMFSSLVPAMLNVALGNPSSCVASTIALADGWMMAHPLGSNVAGSSAAWAEGEPWHQQMDAYNNGLLCAPHRN